MIQSMFQAMIETMTAGAAWAGAWTVGLPLTTALAAVALIGYLFGRRQIRDSASDRQRELEQAQQLISQLQTVSQRIRRSLALQHSSIQQFREKVQDICETDEVGFGDEIAEEAKRILQPTAELSSEIVHTYEEIRSQSSRLDSLNRDRESITPGS